MAAGIMTRAVARAVCGVFAQSLRTHGVPTRSLQLNGKVFTGRFSTRPVEVLFDRICRENGSAHRLTAPRSPTSTGKIERSHRRLRIEFLAGRIFDDLGSAQTEFDGWVVDYNTNRPHRGIGMLTLSERFLAVRDRPAPELHPTSSPSTTPATPPNG